MAASSSNGAAQDGTGARGGFEQHHGTVRMGMPENVVQTPGHHLDSFLGPLSTVSAGMDDEVGNAQVLCPADVADHAVPGLGQKGGVAGGKVDEVGGVDRSGTK